MKYIKTYTSSKSVLLTMHMTDLLLVITSLVLPVIKSTDLKFYSQNLVIVGYGQ